MRDSGALTSSLAVVLAFIVHCSPGAEPQPSFPATSSGPASFNAPGPSIWPEGIGNGFDPAVQTLGISAAGGAGIAAFGSAQAHDLAFLSLSYGHMIGRIMGKGAWYRGNWELRLEAFGGAQFSPDSNWLFGLTPHLRYNFATGTRFVPFLDGGAGLTATGIGPPDLSNTFEFNLQGGVGVHWFVGDEMALTLEGRYLHLSCAGLSQPNQGLNTVLGLVGVTFFF
ncbi:MAG TPA: acyloxyacyl hydrolase [Verrucomicrobiae bacterium]|nr:acyloxyacyl hydrolase [Verrucomicrobiae bacterium]